MALSLSFEGRYILARAYYPVDGEYKPWTADMVGAAASDHTHTKASIGLGNIDNTSDSSKSVKYAASAGSANSASYATKSGSADNEYSIAVQSAQPTDSRCKLWIKI